MHVDFTGDTSQAAYRGNASETSTPGKGISWQESVDSAMGDDYESIPKMGDSTRRLSKETMLGSEHNSRAHSRI